MKIVGESFVGTLFAQIIEQKISEVTYDEIQMAVDSFIAFNPDSVIKVTERDIKKAAKRKKNAEISYDKKTKTVKFNNFSINAYYQMHWSYEAMSLRLYGEDFAKKVLDAYLASKWLWERGSLKASLFACKVVIKFFCVKMNLVGRIIVNNEEVKNVVTRISSKYNFNFLRRLFYMKNKDVNMKDELEKLEDEEDLKALKRAMKSIKKDSKTYTLEEAKKELCIK